MNEPIVFIGPMCAGKSTVAALVSARIGQPRVELDEVRWPYYEEIGFRREDERAAYETGGMDGVFAYWKPFEAHAVCRAVADYPGHVIDLGAGHSVYEEPDSFARVRTALSPCPVILLLPCADVDRAEGILAERLRQLTDEPAAFALNRHFLESPCNALLAKHTLYTEGESAEETAARVMGLVEKGK